MNNSYEKLYASAGKLKKELINYIIKNHELFNESNEDFNAIKMIEVINNLDELDLIHFYLNSSLVKVEEMELDTLITTIKNEKGLNLPF